MMACEKRFGRVMVREGRFGRDRSRGMVRGGRIREGGCGREGFGRQCSRQRLLGSRVREGLEMRVRKKGCMRDGSGGGVPERVIRRKKWRGKHRGSGIGSEIWEMDEVGMDGP